MKPIMNSICVYLGAMHGTNPKIEKAVLSLARQIGSSGLRLVYGGSSQGLMGLLARTVLTEGGKVTGVITQHLIPQEKPLENIHELIITDTMQERKLIMQQRSDAFIVVPGGLGTLEEAFETWDAIKIGLINKPIGFLNIDNYFNGLFLFIDHCVNQGFISLQHSNIPKISASPEELIEFLYENTLEPHIG